MNTYDERDTASVIETTRRRYANASTQIVQVESPRDVDQVPERAETLRRYQRAQRAASQSFIFGLVSLVGGFGPLFLPVNGYVIAALMTVGIVLGIASYITTVVTQLKADQIADQIDALDQRPTIEVPQNALDAWRRIRSITDVRTDAPEWVRTAALHADDVLVELSDLHLDGNGDSPVGRELADALFVTAAHVDAWDLTNTGTANDAETIMPASAALMLEAVRDTVE